MDLKLDGRTFIVTGASRGLGYATAAALVAEGANVVISSRSQDAVNAALVKLNAGGPKAQDAGAPSNAVASDETKLSGNAVGVVAENADPQSANRLVEAALERFGALHGVAISVGGPHAGRVDEVTDEQWRSAFENVFLGAVRIATTAATAMTGPGAILFVLSTSVAQPIPGLAISNGLRPGLAGVAKSLADELGPRGIRVNGLMPGRIATDRVRELDGLAPDPAAARAQHESRIPLRRYGRPEEFGAVAAFLLSDAASYVTGVSLPVDGGLSRRL